MKLFDPALCPKAVDGDTGSLVEMLAQAGISASQPELAGITPVMAWGRYTSVPAAVLAMLFYLPQRICVMGLVDLAHMLLDVVHGDPNARADIRLMIASVESAIDGDASLEGVEQTNKLHRAVNQTVLSMAPRVARCATLRESGQPDLAEEDKLSAIMAASYLVRMVREAKKPDLYAQAGSGFAAGLVLHFSEQQVLQRLYATVPAAAFLGLRKGGEA